MIRTDFAEFGTQDIDLIFELRDLASQFPDRSLVDFEKKPDPVIDHRCQCWLTADHCGKDCRYRTDKSPDDARAERHPNRVWHVSSFPSANDFDETTPRALTRHLGHDRLKCHRARGRFDFDADYVFR
jgi:hypothetical protein